MIKAAQYLRMSTDLQEYSLDNQAEAIQLYAEEHGIVVVRTYMDAGISGLTFERRRGLQSLISDITTGADFERVLVYDVSRWGRFQDMDAGAHYEYICKKAGVPIIYCMESFSSGDAPLDAIAKFLKRYMAAEKSRELSVKVFEGQCRITRLGFKAGGTPGFGLRRLLVDRTGSPKTVLDDGERKSFRTDRVVFTPGPQSETEAVRRIFELRAKAKMSYVRIAKSLNASGPPRRDGRPWHPATVRNLIHNPTYLGMTVWNRYTQRLRTKSRPNDPADWVVVPDTHEAIVSRPVFDAAHTKATRVIVEPEDALDGLRTLLSREGRLSYDLIRLAEGLPDPKTYRVQFGSLANAYRLVGYEPKRDLALQYRLREELIKRVIDGLRALGHSAEVSRKLRRVIVDGSLSIAVTISSVWLDDRGEKHWQLRRPHGEVAQLLIGGRRHQHSDGLRDYCFAKLDRWDWCAFSVDEAGGRLAEGPFTRASIGPDLHQMLKVYC